VRAEFRKKYLDLGGSCRKLRKMLLCVNTEHTFKYCYDKGSRSIRRMDPVTRMWVKVNWNLLLFGNHERKIPYGRPRNRWYENI